MTVWPIPAAIAALLAVACNRVDPLRMERSGTGDLVDAVQGTTRLICIEPPESRRSCSTRTAQVVVRNAPDFGQVWAEWRNDNLVEVTVFGAGPVSCVPSAIDGRVRIVLKRLPIEAMPSAIEWSADSERRFADVQDLCG